MTPKALALSFLSRREIGTDCPDPANADGDFQEYRKPDPISPDPAIVREAQIIGKRNFDEA